MHMTPAFRQYMEEQQNPDVSFSKLQKPVLFWAKTVAEGIMKTAVHRYYWKIQLKSCLVTRLVLHQILQTTDDYRLDDYDLYLGSVAVHPLASSARIQAKGIFGDSKDFILGQSKMVP